MSVIIKGMEMPDTCEECQLMADGWCYGVKNQPGEIYFHARPNWCPLCPLPEGHGRLIDAKALDYAFTDLRFNDDGSLRHWDARKNWCLHGSEVESLIADAPTICGSGGMSHAMQRLRAFSNPLRTDEGC